MNQARAHIFLNHSPMKLHILIPLFLLAGTAVALRRCSTRQRLHSSPHFTAPPGRLMLSFCIRLRSVLGFRFSTFAAPRSPSIIQLVWFRIASMWRRSTSSSDPPSGGSDFVVGRVTPCAPRFGVSDDGAR